MISKLFAIYCYYCRRIVSRLISAPGEGFEPPRPFTGHKLARSKLYIPGLRPTRLGDPGPVQSVVIFLILIIQGTTHSKKNPIRQFYLTIFRKTFHTRELPNARFSRRVLLHQNEKENQLCILRKAIQNSTRQHPPPSRFVYNYIEFKQYRMKSYIFV